MFIIIKIITILTLEVITLRSFYIRLRSEEPDKYFALSKLIGHSSIFYFLKYIFFRMFPIFILCLINYKILPLFTNFDLNQILYFNIMLILIELLFTNIKAYKKYLGIGLSNMHLFISILILIIPYFSNIFQENLSSLLPTAQGILDNIWSAIIIYGVICLFGLTSKKPIEIGNSNLPLLGKEILLSKIKKFSKFIESESKKYNANEKLIKAIAIYESMQRPPLIRFLEKILVSIIAKPISQGVMQYTINKVITDEESITLSIKNYFVDTKSDCTEDDYIIVNLLSKYNHSQRYIKEVKSIYYTLVGDHD